MIETAIEKRECPLASELDGDRVITYDHLSESNGVASLDIAFTRENEGMYVLSFVRCTPQGQGATVSFELHAEFYNAGKNYLSAGERPLPLIYILMAAAFGLQLLVWVALVVINRQHVHYIHHFMTLLLVCKTLSLLFQGVMLHDMQRSGHTDGWSIVYYVFAAAKGFLFFVVILLIGAGWSLVKPFLSEREKNVMAVVLFMQVLVNLGMVLTEELAPGSRQYVEWANALKVFDIACCCAILFPIVWSIRSMAAASLADGKSPLSLIRLRQFRQFYVIVISYIYFTRIIVYLLNLNLAFDVTWVSQLCAEVAAFFFYGLSGWRFRPMTDNPYLMVSADEEDEEDEESGLEMQNGEFGLRARSGTPEPSASDDEEAAESKGDRAAGVAVTADTDASQLTRLPEVKDDGEDEEGDEEAGASPAAARVAVDAAR